jgi:hypothetical protein
MTNVIDFKEIKQDKDLAKEINWLAEASWETCSRVAQSHSMTIAVLKRLIGEYLAGVDGKEPDPEGFIILLSEVLTGYEEGLKEELEGN